MEKQSVSKIGHFAYKASLERLVVRKTAGFPHETTAWKQVMSNTWLFSHKATDGETVREQN
ncbi:MAG: hypothetical protein NC335_11045, partial [Bacteroides sp.]|nr:hypothetical protein [Bacteroides sp.]